MSLILEALRKSEAERRRAHAPDLFAEPALAARPIDAPPRRWLWAALVAIVVLLLAGWFVREQWHAAPTREAALPAVSTSVPPAPPPSDARLRPASGDGTTPVGNANSNSIVAPAATTAVASPVTVPPPPPAPAPGRPSAPRPSAVTAAPAPEPAPATRAPDAVAVAIPAKNPAAATTAVALPAPSAPSLPNNAAPLRLADLSSEERLQLPVLKMSMHLWDAASAQRFVIIDGERLGEGDRLGDAVIEQITPDGAVLAWHGRRLALPMH